MRCAEEFPLLRRAVEKYADKGLSVIFIGHQDRVEKLSAYAKKNGVKDYLLDPDDTMSRKFGMTYGAGVVFMDKEGIVKARIPKAISTASVEAALSKIL